MSGAAAVELALVVLVVALAIAAGLLLGLLLRRRAAASTPPPAEDTVPPAAVRAAVVRQVMARRVRGSQAQPSAGGAVGATSSVGATSTAVTGARDRVCPSCRTAYQDMVYCQRDARRLVSPDELAPAGRGAGLACPGCGRSFEPGLRRCPHDGSELVPQAMYTATRSRPAPAPTGVLAKVCPVCRRKFDLSSRFCGRDGHELVVVN